MKFIYGIPVAIVAIVLVTSVSGICLPCQPSIRRYTAWDNQQDVGLNVTRSPRMIYNPKITNPTDTTIWVAGSQVVVTWYVHYLLTPFDAEPDVLPVKP